MRNKFTLLARTRLQQINKEILKLQREARAIKIYLNSPAVREVRKRRK